MLTLYYKPTCPFSQRVLAEAEQLQVTLNLKDISMDLFLLEELMELGGKTQTPFLLDKEHNIAMYDSTEIIAYLTEYSTNQPETKQTFGGLRIHESDEICDSCQ